MAKTKDIWMEELADRCPVPACPSAETVLGYIDGPYLDANKFNEERVRERHSQIFDDHHAEDARSAKVRLEAIQKTKAERQALKNRVQSDRDASPTADAGAGAEHAPGPIPWPDLVTLLFFGLIMVLVYLLSGTLVYSTIQKTQPELIVKNDLRLYTYFAVPLFFPVILDVMGRHYLSIRGQRRFQSLIHYLTLIGSIVFMIAWSLDSFGSNRPIQDVFAEAFNRASGQQAPEPTTTEVLRTMLAPYDLFIQLAAEGLIITTLWAFIMNTWRSYSYTPPGPTYRVMQLEQSLTAVTIEFEAYGEHEAKLQNAVDTFAKRKAELIAEAVSKCSELRKILTSSNPDGTVRPFRRP